MLKTVRLQRLDNFIPRQAPDTNSLINSEVQPGPSRSNQCPDTDHNPLTEPKSSCLTIAQRQTGEISQNLKQEKTTALEPRNLALMQHKVIRGCLCGGNPPPAGPAPIPVQEIQISMTPSIRPRPHQGLHRRRLSQRNIPPSKLCYNVKYLVVYFLLNSEG